MSVEYITTRTNLAYGHQYIAPPGPEAGWSIVSAKPLVVPNGTGDFGNYYVELVVVWMRMVPDPAPEVKS